MSDDINRKIHIVIWKQNLNPKNKKQKKLLTSLDFVMFIVMEFHEFKVGPLITNSNKWNVPYFPINQDYSVSLVYPYSVGFLGIPLPTSGVIKSNDLPKNVFVQIFKVVGPWCPPSAPTLPETHWGRSDQSTKRLPLRYRPLEEGTKI